MVILSIQALKDPAPSRFVACEHVPIPCELMKTLPPGFLIRIYDNTTKIEFMPNVFFQQIFDMNEKVLTVKGRDFQINELKIEIIFCMTFTD